MSLNKLGPQGHIEFALQSVQNGLARGWVRDRVNPQRQLQVMLVVDGEVFTDWADISRPDLARPGMSHTDCGFCIPFSRTEFQSIALLVDGLCLHAEVALPDRVPAPPAALDADTAAGLFAPGWRQRPLLALFADLSWDVHPGRARELARAIAAAGWDVAYIEPVFRNVAGLRAQAVEEGRVCRITLPARAGQADLEAARLDGERCLHWKAQLQALARGRTRCASLYAGARWVDLMALRPLPGPCILDLEHDPCGPSPWQLSRVRVQAAIAAADALTVVSPCLALPDGLSGKPCVTLRNGFDSQLLSLQCPAVERRYLFGASATLERAQGARWLRDFLQSNPGLPAVVVGGGTLAPMFAHLAQTQTNLSFLGPAAPLVAGFCLARSRFGLLATSGAPWANPSAFYECLALGVPPLGPFAPDCEDALRAAFTEVASGPVQAPQLEAAQTRFAALRADITPDDYSWNARARQLLVLLRCLMADDARLGTASA